MSLLNYQFTSPRGLAKHALAGVLVGGIFATGLMCSLFCPSIRQFALYAMFVAVFHFLEFLMVALFHPETLTFDSWLLNHSSAYRLAMLASVLEFWLEYVVVDVIMGIPFKTSGTSMLISCVGLILMVPGQSLRSIAMFQCGRNFTHLVAEEKKDQHKLVTEGVYSHLRHPSYTGWFWWSVGCQLLLANPICVVAWAAASWNFFSERIAVEERYLHQFFGPQYKEYHARSGIYIPFIKTTL